MIEILLGAILVTLLLPPFVRDWMDTFAWNRWVWIRRRVFRR